MCTIKDTHTLCLHKKITIVDDHPKIHAWLYLIHVHCCHVFETTPKSHAEGLCSHKLPKSLLAPSVTSAAV